MKMMVPTVMVDALVKEVIEDGGKVWKIGEFIRLPYAIALQLRALGFVGAFTNEDAMHAQATEYLQIYGGDSWFSHSAQTIRHVGDYLALASPNVAPENGKPN